MCSVFEKIYERFENLKYNQDIDTEFEVLSTLIWKDAIQKAKQIVNEEEDKYHNGWISCKKELPRPEEEVLILARRKFFKGKFIYIKTIAIYEDGTIPESDSIWAWRDLSGEYSEENDCYIIPKGWYESIHYSQENYSNYAVDDEVLFWQKLP